MTQAEITLETLVERVDVDYTVTLPVICRKVDLPHVSLTRIPQFAMHASSTLRFITWDKASDLFQLFEAIASLPMARAVIVIVPPHSSESTGQGLFMACLVQYMQNLYINLEIISAENDNCWWKRFVLCIGNTTAIR